MLASDCRLLEALPDNTRVTVVEENVNLVVDSKLSAGATEDTVVGEITFDPEVNRPYDSRPVIRNRGL